MRTILLLAAIARLFGEGIVSTPGDEFGAQLTPDGQTMYFCRSIPRSVLYVICVTHLRNGKWSEPEIAPFSGHYRDPDPVLSPDGKRLYFASDRPKPGEKEPNYDIWFVELEGPRANVAQHLGGAVNTDDDEFFASEAADGTLYVASDRPGGIGVTDIYRIPRVGNEYPKAEDLGEPVNRKGVFTVETLIAPDQSFMIIGCFGGPGGAGDSDLFVSRNTNGTWSTPAPLPVNTPAREYSPRFSPDGKSLMFSSEKGTPTDRRDKPITYDELVRSAARTTNGLGNIYTVELEGVP